MQTKTLYQTKYLSLFENQYGEHSYFVASRNPNYNGKQSAPAAVTIFAIDPEKERMLITSEYRYTVNDWTTSTPAGLIDDNDTPEETALRELAEETGYTKAEVKQVLPATYSSVGMTDERVIPVILHVDATEHTQPDLQDEERITHKWVNKQEAMVLVLTGTNLTARAQLALMLFATGQFD